MSKNKSNLVKIEKTTNALSLNSELNFSLTPTLVENINMDIVERVLNSLPVINEKTKYFDRQNSQSTLSFMSLTMMTGQSPYRMLRQVLAEIAQRKIALAESQVAHSEMLVGLEELQTKTDPVSLAKIRQTVVSISGLEEKVNGSFKDIAVLMDAYDNLIETNNINDWDEESFERAEKVHHVRRGFELMYRDIVGSGNNTCGVGTLEYLEQYGVHPQVAHRETVIYVEGVNTQINDGVVLHGNHLEDFLDHMGEKYSFCVDLTSERMYGKQETLNTKYMITKGESNDHTSTSQ